jgi:hypothetical protein
MWNERSMLLLRLREVLTRLQEYELERRHRAGYRRRPVEPGEFGDWEDEQVWRD